MKDENAKAKTIIEDCIVGNMRSGRCKNGSYYRKFSANYYDYYINDKGDKVYDNMRQWIVGFNDVARFIKAEIDDGDRVYIFGRLKSREIVNHIEEVFIEVDDIKDIIKLPSGFVNEKNR